MTIQTAETINAEIIKTAYDLSQFSEEALTLTTSETVTSYATKLSALATKLADEQGGVVVPIR